MTLCPEPHLQTLQLDWKHAHGFVFEAHLEPADSLRGRVDREFKNRTLSALNAVGQDGGDSIHATQKKTTWLL